MDKIIRIDSARHIDSECWELGKETEYNSGLFITEIKDNSVEFLDSVEYQFDIYVNKKLWKSLINMPIQIEYELEGDSNG